METLKGKNAIVTGANRGIGLAIVKALAEHGCNIWACARGANEEFEGAMQGLEKEHDVWIEPVYFELSEEKEITQGIRHIITEKKDIDILCNVAGIGHMQLFGLTSMQDVRQIFQVNTFAPMQIAQLVMRRMRRQQKGYILNITSTAGEEVFVGNALYGATKAALNQFTKSLAAEVAGEGITVNAIAPGLTDTRMSAVFEGENPELPLERSFLNRKIEPSEIAGIVIALVSDEMRIVNGQVIKANGGGIS